MRVQRGPLEGRCNDYERCGVSWGKTVTVVWSIRRVAGGGLWRLTVGWEAVEGGNGGRLTGGSRTRASLGGRG